MKWIPKKNMYSFAAATMFSMAATFDIIMASGIANHNHPLYWVAGILCAIASLLNFINGCTLPHSDDEDTDG